MFLFENRTYQFSEVTGRLGNDYVEVKRENGSDGRINITFIVHDTTPFHELQYRVISRSIEFGSNEVCTIFIHLINPNYME